MPLLAFAGWSFGPLLADTHAEARALAFVTDYDHLGDDTAARMARLAEITNRAVSEFMEDNAALGQAYTTCDLPQASGWLRVPGTVTTATPSSAAVTGEGTAFTVDLSVGQQVVFFGGEFTSADIFTIGSIADDTHLTLTTSYTQPATSAVMMVLSTAAAARNILIPPDLLGTDIIEVQFNSPDESLIYKFRQIIFIEPGGVQQMPNWVKNDQYESPHPFYCAFNELRNALAFYPWPGSGALTCSIRYRQRPYVFTAADVTTPASLIIGEVPKRFQRVIALRIAMDLTATINTQRYGELAMMYSNLSDQGQPGEREKASTLFATTLASLTQGRQNEALPDRVVNYHSIFNFSAVGSRRRCVR